MPTKVVAVLVTIAFSVIGVLGDYFLKLASACEQPLRTAWFYFKRLITKTQPNAVEAYY